MMHLNLRFTAAGVCGLLVALSWRPQSTRGLLVLLMFAFHSVAFVQASSWRSGALALSESFLSVGAQAGLVAAVGAMVAFGVRRMLSRVFSVVSPATSTPVQ
jgi:hypothetical protein